MADKKTTTKKTTKVTEAAVLTIDELTAKLTEVQSKLLEAKRGHHAGELANPHILTVTRKEIARLHTQIRADQIKQAKEAK